MTSILKFIRLLTIPTSVREVQGDTEPKTGASTSVCENLSTVSTKQFSTEVGLCKKFIKHFRCFFYGLLMPLSFAPFHLPGFAIIGLALLFHELHQPTCQSSKSKAAWQGFLFGLGFFGVGTSWIYVSIQEYGHLNILLAGCITLLFIIYLSLFTAMMSTGYVALKTSPSTPSAIVAFAAIWTLSEYLRASIFTGFPWLLVGFGQFDTPLKFLLPFVGVYGVSFITASCAGLLVIFFQQSKTKRLTSLSCLVALLLAPQWMHQPIVPSSSSKPLHVAIIQSNLSMRDKWDETLFWNLLNHYRENIYKLLGNDIIVLPESAFPISMAYIQDILHQLSDDAKKAKSSILLGIPKPDEADPSSFYNALVVLGQGDGIYLKQHLVPFGEYVPTPFHRITQVLGVPEINNLQAGSGSQPLIHTQDTSVASLICYELAYGELLRTQLPQAQWIVSISDDGWFGHSLAMYQQQQIAQVRSIQTHRYQIMANNDGLSSVIDPFGNIVAELKPFTQGNLQANLVPLRDTTYWVTWGDNPILVLLSMITIFIYCRRRKEALSLPASQIVVKPHG